MLIRVAAAWMLIVGMASVASAQNGSSGTSTAQSQPGASTSSSAEPQTRPATTTFLGDTGLWFVPTAEVLAHGKWSVSGYRRGTNYIQGFTNVGDFAGTFARRHQGPRRKCLAPSCSTLASIAICARSSSSIRPVGGIVDRYPRVNQGWTGDNVGDLYLGAKVNLASEYHQKPVSMAVRGILKVPTGKDDVGTSTGKTDFLVDFIASKELNRGSRCRATAAMNSAASPMASMPRAERSGGAVAPAIPRAVRCVECSS